MKDIYTSEILSKSEECWEQANFIAYNIQKNNEKKLDKHKN